MKTTDIIKQFQKRGLIIVRDDASEQVRAVLVSPAELATQEMINEVIAESRGNLLVALSAARCEAFQLEPMQSPRTSHRTGDAERDELLAMCTSIDAREGITTGISAYDRTLAVQILAEEHPNPRRIVKPGHVFPVKVRDGGVLVRQALAEGALDIVTVAGYRDAALFADLLNQMGDFSSQAELASLAERLRVPILDLTELTRYRLQNERLVSRVAEARLPTTVAGEMRSIIYKSKIHDGEHLALIKGEIDPSKPTLVRVQTEFTFTDVFGGGAPASRATIQGSLQAIGERGSGVLLYLRRTNQGALRDQITFSDQPREKKPVSMMREYGVGAQILADLGVTKIELLTNSKPSLVGLDSFGIRILNEQAIPEARAV